MSLSEKDRAHRAEVSEFLRKNPEIMKRAQARRRRRLYRLGLAGGRR